MRRRDAQMESYLTEVQGHLLVKGRELRVMRLFIESGHVGRVRVGHLDGGKLGLELGDARL